MREIEILIIDDGSSKSCKEDLNDLRNKYSFFLLTQENKGVSAARNFGLSVSTGNYIMFVDADDTLQEGCLMRGMELAEKNHADMVIGGINIVKHRVTEACSINCDNVLVLEKEKIDMLQRYMVAIRCTRDNDILKGFRCTGPWAKIIRKDIVKNIYFNEKLQLYEDLLFNLEALDNAKKIVIDTDIWYNYFIYQNSAIHKYRENGIEQLEYVIRIFDKLNKKNSEWQAAISIKTMECVVRTFSNTVFHRENKNKKVESIRIILENEIVNKLLNGFNEDIYFFKNYKEKYLWNAFRKKQVLKVWTYYQIKRWIWRK